MNESNILQSKTKMLSRIFCVLKEEVADYEQLNRTVLQKQKAILSNDISLIKAKSEEEQVIARRVNTKTVERYELIKSTLNNDEEASLSSLLEKHGLSADSNWNRYRGQLKHYINQIRRTNKENALLLQTSLKFTQDLIKMYYPQDEQNSLTYTSEGKSSKNNKAMLSRGV